jgi:hypothetical protein
VGFVVDKVALGQVFTPSTSVFSCQFHSTGAPLLGKGQKKNTIIIVITGLHKKPQGCGTTLASAAGPFSTKKKHVHTFYKLFVKDVYSETRHVSIHRGTIIRGGTENKTLVIRQRARCMPCVSNFTLKTKTKKN